MSISFLFLGPTALFGFKPYEDLWPTLVSLVGLGSFQPFAQVPLYERFITYGRHAHPGWFVLFVFVSFFVYFWFVLLVCICFLFVCFFVCLFLFCFLFCLFVFYLIIFALFFRCFCAAKFVLLFVFFCLFFVYFLLDFEQQSLFY